jgi:hypothetical protein
VLDCGNAESLLAVGSGCSGAGVRLVTLSSPKVFTVMGREEYDALLPQGGHGKPMFRIDQADWRIHLDILRAGYRLKPGKKRDPKLPSILLDRQSEEFFVDCSDIYRSVDITDKLRQAGVHIDETICLADHYRRQWERH